MYSMLNGTFAEDGMHLGMENFKARLHAFFSQYLQRVSAGYTNLMQHFSALSYLPMDRNIFFSIQNFINMLTLRFSEVKHVLLQFSGLIIWNDLEVSETATVSHYVSKFLHPDVLEKEMQAIHFSTLLQQASSARLGRFYHGFSEHSATKDNDLAAIHGFLKTCGNPSSTNMTRYRLVVYGVAGVLACLFLLDLDQYDDSYSARIASFLDSSLAPLAQPLAEQYLRFKNPKWQQDTPHVKYIYINEATLAQKQTLVDRNQVVQGEFLKALIGIYDDVRSQNDHTEIYEKVFHDCWIYGKRTFAGSLYAIVTQRNIDLVLAEEELRKLCMKEFPDSQDALT